MELSDFVWVECICDLNGNDRSPGYDADYYKDGEQGYIALGGQWEYYKSEFSDLVCRFLPVNETPEQLHVIFDGTLSEIYDYVSSLASNEKV